MGYTSTAAILHISCFMILSLSLFAENDDPPEVVAMKQNASRIRPREFTASGRMVVQFGSKKNCIAHEDVDSLLPQLSSERS